MADRVWLVGPMAVGKSTIGRAVAGRLGWAYVDNDDELARRTGLELEHWPLGEALHRAEAEVVADLAHRPGPLVAGIPGSVGDRPELLDLLAGSGRVVHLTAPLEVLVARARGTGRPLGADAAATLAELTTRRGSAYARIADLVCDTTAEPATTVERICAFLGAGSEGVEGVTAVTLGVADPERARTFYRAALDLQPPVELDAVWPGARLTYGVPDLAAATEAVRAAGCQATEPVGDLVVARDPVGLPFALAPVAPPPPGVAAVTLYVPDADVVRGFYAAVLGRPLPASVVVGRARPGVIPSYAVDALDAGLERVRAACGSATAQGLCTDDQGLAFYLVAP